MARPLLDYPRQYKRPMDRKAILTMVSRLATAPKPLTYRDLSFPLGRARLIKLAAAINALDTSGKPALTARQLHDPWNSRTISRLRQVVVP